MADGPNMHTYTMLNECGTAADHRTEPKVLFGLWPVGPNIRMDFRKDAPLFFDSRTRPWPISVKVSEIQFAKAPFCSEEHQPGISVGNKNILSLQL